jgi:hypothetical protein
MMFELGTDRVRLKTIRADENEDIKQQIVTEDPNLSAGEEVAA